MTLSITTIRALSKLMRDTGLCALELQEGETYLKLERPVHAPAEPSAARSSPALSAPADDPGLDFKDVKTVTSPMVGVFYAAPAPDREPFVQVGSRVKAGDVLCIVEAMKLMNEINAELDGEIVDVCVSNGDIVEFGQTLFKII